jgi:hypothetical protein
MPAIPATKQLAFIDYLIMANIHCLLTLCLALLTVTL